MLTTIPCMVMRGGTSKGPFFLASDLPGDPAQRDRVLLAVMGCPWWRMLGGYVVGSATQAIVRRSQYPRPLRSGCLRSIL